MLIRFKFGGSFHGGPLGCDCIRGYVPISVESKVCQVRGQGFIPIKVSFKGRTEIPNCTS
jgi:hypothetical protein